MGFDIALQAVATQVMLHHDLRYWNTTEAPSPHEIIWGNLGYVIHTDFGGIRNMMLDRQCRGLRVSLGQLSNAQCDL